MKAKQILCLVAAAVFFLLALYGLFYFPVPVIVICMMLHSFSLLLLAYLNAAGAGSGAADVSAEADDPEDLNPYGGHNEKNQTDLCTWYSRLADGRPYRLCPDRRADPRGCQS